MIIQPVCFSLSEFDWRNEVQSNSDSRKQLAFTQWERVNGIIQASQYVSNLFVNDIMCSVNEMNHPCKRYLDILEKMSEFTWIALHSMSRSQC